MGIECDPKDIAIKSFFLGPQSENADWLAREWAALLEHWLSWRGRLYPDDGLAITERDKKTPEFQKARERLHQGLQNLMGRFEQETPKFTPRYVGHMVTEASLPAILGHVVALLHNPNNTAKDVAKVGSVIEREAIADLAKMLGFKPESARGHFTSGGTVANFEALWRARYRADHWVAMATQLATEKKCQLKDFFRLAHMGWVEFHARKKEVSTPEAEFKKNSFVACGPWEFSRHFKSVWGAEFKGPVVLVPGNKHFSWPKAVSLFGFGDEALWPVDLDENGRLDLVDLKRKISRAEKENRPVLMVVSVCGTTEMGEVDPLHEVQNYLDELRAQSGLHIWHHVDAAYGGYYRTMLDGDVVEEKLDPQVAAALRGLGRVNSVTLDPHKLGYVPYSCGALLVRDAENYRVRSFAAPYLVQPEENAWAYTIEGSRSASGATATWLSNRCMGLNGEGYGRVLEKGIQAKNEFVDMVREKIPEAILIEPQDLNIVCMALGHRGERLSQVNARTEWAFRRLQKGPHFSVSKTVLSTGSYSRLIHRVLQKHEIAQDRDEFFLLRLVMMNPFIVAKEMRNIFLKGLVEELALSVDWADAEFK